MSERWKLSPHARERMEEMGLDWRLDVLEAVHHPESDYPCDAKVYGPGRRTLTSGDLAIVYGMDRSIVTILWNRAESRDQTPLRIIDGGRQVDYRGGGRGAPHVSREAAG